MFMLSLMQESRAYEQDTSSLASITAQLLQMIHMKSQTLYTHSVQVANYSVAIAAKLGLPKGEIELIRQAAYLHDLGLICLPSTLLMKFPYLNRQELSKYKQHPVFGASMIENYPVCQPIVPYIKYHHERWDGTGFPKHLRGANIPLGARIIGIADYYVTSIDPSSDTTLQPRSQIKQDLFRHSGTMFDPDIVKAFIEILG